MQTINANMDRWLKKVVVVTGASAGIGAAIALELTEQGLIVVALARRIDRMEELSRSVPQGAKGELHLRRCDVSKEDEVKSTFDWINATFGGIDVLVNNAGILRTTNLIDADNTKSIREVVDTNVMGVVYCTREAFQSMKRRSVDGHIIIINSIAGHKVPFLGVGRPSMNIYPATKHAITAYTEVLRQELIAQGTKTKITVSVESNGCRSNTTKFDWIFRHRA